MDLSAYRASPTEQARITDLLSMMPPCSHALDVGAREGYLSIRMVERCDRVTALDLTLPVITHKKITSVQGNVTALNLPDNSFDNIMRGEVLEHIPPELLLHACREIARVSKNGGDWRSF